MDLAGQPFFFELLNLSFWFLCYFSNLMGLVLFLEIRSSEFIALFVFPAFDHRFGWSQVPLFISLAGDALIAFAFLLFFIVFKVNTYGASTIQITEGQKVISTGPYALVRHPMYAGAIPLLIGVPLALGSWWGLFVLIPLMPVLIWRILDEERFLKKRLPGYTDYCQKVRYHLVPFIW